ncbi:hypothetical protein PGT21_023639 [Puccinia graminis f. sp. tritici]|uniref:Uncharacterized protein n=1 Tax=Puccinia graminis f. sp. tritici TaxID=56615 RepID=A0A5B0R371_PUCGR|nr:hypothetical protein PGT21_023639 [Puccinia graminis f. sp. tritici]
MLEHAIAPHGRTKLWYRGSVGLRVPWRLTALYIPRTTWEAEPAPVCVEADGWAGVYYAQSRGAAAGFCRTDGPDTFTYFHDHGNKPLSPSPATVFLNPRLLLETSEKKSIDRTA